MDDTQALQQQIDTLKRELEEVKAQQIKIVSDFDGTNVQVSIRGIRRKIATTAP